MTDKNIYKRLLFISFRNGMFLFEGRLVTVPLTRLHCAYAEIEGDQARFSAIPLRVESWISS